MTCIRSCAVYLTKDFCCRILTGLYQLVLIFLTWVGRLSRSTKIAPCVQGLNFGHYFWHTQSLLCSLPVSQNVRMRWSPGKWSKFGNGYKPAKVVYFRLRVITVWDSWYIKQLCSLPKKKIEKKLKGSMYIKLSNLLYNKTDLMEQNACSRRLFRLMVNKVKITVRIRVCTYMKYMPDGKFPLNVTK